MEITPNATSNANSTLEIEELAIALYAETLDPKIAQPDFLKFSGIIPPEWNLQSPAILRDTLTQLVFENGVNLLAQPRTVNFFEALAGNGDRELLAPAIARKYAQKLPNVNYQALSINPKLLVGFPAQPQAARKYIVDTLLAPGPWRKFGTGQLRASLELVYPLPRGQLQLKINEVRVQPSDRPPLPALLFSGSFNYEISGTTPTAKQQEIEQQLDNWQTDLETFRHLIRQQFLGEPASLFPPEMM